MPGQPVQRNFAAYRTVAVVALAAAAVGGAGSRLDGQGTRPLPFAVGEHLTYDTRAGRMLSGRAEMWIEGPVEVQGASAIVLRFSFTTGFGPLGVSDETISWWDPVRGATLRFAKRERRLLDRYTEEVDVDPENRRWRANDGREGESPSSAPLDELSFIYVIRTLDGAGDSTLRLSRHFDAERSPTTIRFAGRDTVTTALGSFATREVEMRVRDARHYDGEGVIRLSLSDDECRRPVRIVSSIPGAGTVVMTLAAARPMVPACEPRVEGQPTANR